MTMDAVRLAAFRCLAFRRFERVERAERARRLKDGTACGFRLECGGTCCLAAGHARDHECDGDDPWKPGSCPA